MFVWAARVRRVLSDTLGVNADDLAGEVSLTDDLAADSLDLMQLVIALEEEFSIDIDERRLASVRTVADLVTVMHTLIAPSDETNGEPATARSGRARQLELSPEPCPLPYRATLTGGAQSSTTLFRTGILTPYSTEAILDDALCAGKGALLEISVPLVTSDTDVRIVRDHFEWLAARGIRVRVERDYRPPAWKETPAPPAA